MTDYIVLGHVFDMPRRYEYPWSIVELLGVGQAVSLALEPADEAALIRDGLIELKASTVVHTYLR
jgi:hypothetical protein